MTELRRIPAPDPVVPPEEARAASERFLETMRSRRTIRDYVPEPVDPRLLENAVATAATAPSGANVQPWRFVVVTDPELKRRIREGAEEEERTFYAERAPAGWLAALEPLGTDEHKPHLEEAAALTHTPSPMRFLNEILGRPSEEKPYVVVAVGRAAAGATVPDLARKPLDEVLVWLGPR